MAITKEILTTLAQQHDSFYLYDQAGITECAERLKGAFPFASFLYSVKCNPHPQVLQTVFAQGFGADAASLGEVLLAAENGLQGVGLWNLMRPAPQTYLTLHGGFDIEVMDKRDRG